MTVEGYKPAKEIKVGDKLYTIAPADMSEGQVDNAQVPSKVNLVEVEVVKAEVNEKSELIKFNDIEDMVSPKQPVFVKKSDAEHAPNSIIITYKKASEVEIGDILIQVQPEICQVNEIEIKTIEKIPGSYKVYDIRTQPWPWFMIKGFTVVS